MDLSQQPEKQSALLTSQVWQDLARHQHVLRDCQLTELFEQDEQRFQNFSFRHDQLLYDFSKNLITDQTLDLLVTLSEQVGLKQKIEDLFAGERVNASENRPALHTALRDFSSEQITIGNYDVLPQIKAVREKMQVISERLRAGLWLGATEKPITHVVNLGVGGSDLGPRMVCEAFKQVASIHVKVSFVSSIDGNQVVETLKQLDPETTLFIISSKSFTTSDTMANAETARNWLCDKLGGEADLARHFIGVSANPGKMEAWGIAEDNCLPMWEWVGGRYSVWSAIGLSVAISLGMAAFEQFLLGAEAADRHFRETDLRHNIPVLQALIGVWYTNFWKAESLAVLPYDYRLQALPSFLQQLEMESNGKSIGLDDEPVQLDTAPIIWGEFGPNAQHAFYQLLHQGTRFVPVEFLAVVSNCGVPEKHHELALANCFAQSRALMFGKAISRNGSGVSPSMHSHYPGNKPSTTILLGELSPRSLGSLIAFYEHKVFVQSVIWGINPFDQWGVELGKKLAGQLLEDRKAGRSDSTEYDVSTRGLLAFVNESKKN